MKVLKARFKRLRHQIKHFGNRHQAHLSIDRVTTFTIWGIPVWTKTTEVSCSCGRVFYKELK